MPTIIYPPSIPWNWMFQRPQQILRKMASLGYTVLYEDLANYAQPGAKALTPNFYLCQGVSALSIPHIRPRILWLTVPSHIELISQYKPDLVIYDAVDEPKEEFAGWAQYYPEIAARANLIFGSGKSIYAHFSSLHPNVHLVPNGVDYAHFSAVDLPRPKDLPRGKPVIGYSGAIAPWVDWDLLKFVAGNSPHLNFVFIGSLFQIRKFPLKSGNISYLGLKNYNRLPAYLKHFTVGLIPFKITEMTKGCNPIKLYEYYAAGSPVLGTPLPELLNIPGIDLDSDPERFSIRLDQIVKRKDDGLPTRTAFAKSNDWSVRALQMSRKIEETFGTKAL